MERTLWIVKRALHIVERAPLEDLQALRKVKAEVRT